MIPTRPGLHTIGLPRHPMSRLVTRNAIDWAYATGWMAVRVMPESAARTAFESTRSGTGCLVATEVSVMIRPQCRLRM